MKLLKTIQGIFFRCKPTNQKAKSLEEGRETNKPVEVIIVPTSSTKAAIIRDWIAASLLVGFAGLTIHDRFIKPKNIEHLDAILREFDLNGDGHLSKEEIDAAKELIREFKQKK